MEYELHELKKKYDSYDELHEDGYYTAGQFSAIFPEFEEQIDKNDFRKKLLSLREERLLPHRSTQMRKRGKSFEYMTIYVFISDELETGLEAYVNYKTSDENKTFLDWYVSLLSIEEENAWLARKEPEKYLNMIPALIDKVVELEKFTDKQTKANETVKSLFRDVDKRLSTLEM